MLRACAAALAAVCALAAPSAAGKSRPKERSYVQYLKVTDSGPTIRWGFYVCLPRPATLRWQIEVRSLSTKEIDRYTHFSKDRQARNCTYYELELRDLRSRFDVGLDEMAFVARLRREPALRAAVETWLAGTELEALEWEQRKHERLLAA